MHIETDRLILRKHALKDFDRFWEMLNDPVAKRYTGGVTRLGYAERLALYREDMALPFSEEGAEFAVIEKGSRRYVGYCGFRYCDELNEYELFYGYCRDAWGQGYGTEAARAVLDYAFRTYAHPQYVATVEKGNAASVRVLEKLGFHKTAIYDAQAGALDAYILQNGKERDGMDIHEAIASRHSVRQYTDRPLDAETIAALQAEIDACNSAGDLHIQLVTNEPTAFSGGMARYGSFSGVKNYIALIGKRAPDLDERLGYYGERIVLKAQMLGLNTCWVALTYSKRKSRCEMRPGEKRVCVISLGYGRTQGVPHKSKPMASLCSAEGDMPTWFKAGMEAALLAPTATNQQRFLLTLCGDQVSAAATGGFYSKMDLGIVKYHFEIGAGRDRSLWL